MRGDSAPATNRAPIPAATAQPIQGLPTRHRPPARPGNVVVVFQPDATEAQIRTVLTATGARLVDGPPGADAYVLSVSPSQREKALATLRASHPVVAAEPVDSAGAP